MRLFGSSAKVGSPAYATRPFPHALQSAWNQRKCELRSRAVNEFKRQHFKEKETRSKNATKLEERETKATVAPTDLSRDGVAEISKALRELLADVFALYLKTKTFHWHKSGRHFRDYNLL